MTPTPNKDSLIIVHILNSNSNSVIVVNRSLGNSRNSHQYNSAHNSSKNQNYNNADLNFNSHTKFMLRLKCKIIDPIFSNTSGKVSTRVGGRGGDAAATVE